MNLTAAPVLAEPPSSESRAGEARESTLGHTLPGVDPDGQTRDSRGGSQTNLPVPALAEPLTDEPAQADIATGEARESATNSNSLGSCKQDSRGGQSILFMLKILQGDAIEQLATLPDESVHCCVTSPPYWGLRDYSCEGQLGLEKTPEEYVAKMVEVFREVRRVLRKDGTLWLNLGDSYHGSWGNSGSRPELDGKTQNQREKNVDYLNRGGWDERRERPASSYKIPGLKPKDLCGTTGAVAIELGRKAILIELNHKYVELITRRCDVTPGFALA